MPLSLSALAQHCQSWIEPFSQRPLAALGLSIDIQMDSPDVYTLRLSLPYPHAGTEDQIQHSLFKHVSAYHPAEYHITIETRYPQTAQQKPHHNIIGIASAKGGVGKSTITAHLAYCAARAGARVGLLDADLYGPSVPLLFNCPTHRATLNTQQQFEVFTTPEQLSLMSIGFLVNHTDAMIWRGPIATRTLLQLLNQTAWPPLDYLFIDMPPGTGDIPLSLAQKAGLDGVLIVTTAQALAVADAKRGEQLWAKVKIPVLGIIDNMSYMTCTHCAEKTWLFGQALPEHHFHAPVLAHLPFIRTIAATAHLQPTAEQLLPYQTILAELSVQLISSHAS